jgi:hypothetical protein
MPSRKQKGRRHRKQRGGDSASYGFGGAVAAGAPYASEVVAKEGCVAATRPGTLVGYSGGSGGLPGFGGGGRSQVGGNPLRKLYEAWKARHQPGYKSDPGFLEKAFKKWVVNKPRSALGLAPLGSGSGATRRPAARTAKVEINTAAKEGGGRKKSTKFSFKKLFNGAKTYFASRRVKKQRGGRWTADVGAPLLSGPNQFVPVSRMACEGGMVDTSPPGAVSAVVSTKQMGGAGTLASPYYSAQTAGYGNQASTWASASGTPSLLQIPNNARTMNPACLKTGGGRRRKNSKGSRRTRRR